MRQWHERGRGKVIFSPSFSLCWLQHVMAAWYMGEFFSHEDLVALLPVVVAVMLQHFRGWSSRTAGSPTSSTSVTPLACHPGGSSTFGVPWTDRRSHDLDPGNGATLLGGEDVADGFFTLYCSAGAARNIYPSTFDPRHLVAAQFQPQLSRYSKLATLALNHCLRRHNEQCYPLGAIGTNPGPAELGTQLGMKINWWITEFMLMLIQFQLLLITTSFFVTIFGVVVPLFGVNSKTDTFSIQNAFQHVVIITGLIGAFFFYFSV